MSDDRGALWYFAVTDRFAEGDAGNPMGKDADFDPSRRDFGRWWGGDLAGAPLSSNPASRINDARIIAAWPCSKAAPASIQGRGRQTTPALTGKGVGRSG